MRRIWGQTKACCVLSASGFGDSLMATPLVEGIKRCNPDIRLVVASTDVFSEVFEGNPHVDALLTYSLRPWDLISLARLVWRLRRERIDVFLAAQPANTIRHSLVAALSGAKVRLKHTYDYGSAFERDFSFVYHVRLSNSMKRHRVELNLDLLRFLGEEIPEGSISPYLKVGREAREKVEGWLLSVNGGQEARDLVALHPGGVRQNKRWAAQGFSEVGRAMVNWGFSLCLVGGREERNLCRSIAEEIGAEGVLDAAGLFSLEETAALLKKCRCLVSNDTGIMHLAAAVETPVVALFGPTDFRHIGPFSMQRWVLQGSRDMKDISPIDVLEAVSAAAGMAVPGRSAPGQNSSRHRISHDSW
ncbi:MAG: glycosyltransferase family 9 protein [Deltaproteobacteria bacterium]|nr:glycosyltransferase family 9 protein [Deltaproteobacteria bacterium]